MTQPTKARTVWGRRLALLLGVGLLLSAAIGVEAQRDRRAYFINLLRTSSSFRVRAQAALQLGRQQVNPAVRDALTTALAEDDEPAVRVAAASAIERLADPAMLSDTQRALRRERDRTVRTAGQRAIRAMQQARRSASSGGSSGSGSDSGGTRGTPRYYVGVGIPGTRVSSIGRSDLAGYQRYLQQQLRRMEGVVIAPNNESNSAARSVLRRRHLYGYFLDASIVSLEQNSSGTSARVSVILASYPERDMRAMLSGGARLPGGTGPQAAEQAIQGALRGAIRDLPRAMRTSEARASR